MLSFVVTPAKGIPVISSGWPDRERKGGWPAMHDGSEGFESRWEQLMSEGRYSEAGQLYEEMFPVVIERVCREFREGVVTGPLVGRCILVQTVGLSPLPLILVIRALEPKFIYFVHTEQSLSSVDAVTQYLGLATSRYQKVPVDGTDVYQAIRNIASRLAEGGVPVVADLTGGTKVMSVQLALFSAMRGYSLVYVRHRTRHRNIVPGSEAVVVIENPYEVFRPIEFGRALEAANSGAFDRASSEFGRLERILSEPVSVLWARALRLYCGMLRDWHEFHYEGAEESASALEDLFRQYPFLSSLKETVQAQVHTVKRLASTATTPLFDALKDPDTARLMVLDIYANALRCDGRGRVADATVRYYRAIELIGQHLLALRDIDTAAVRWESVPEDAIALFRRIDATFRGQSSEGPLPEKLAMTQGYSLLVALRDSVVLRFLATMIHKDAVAGGDDVLSKLGGHLVKRLRRAAEARNNHILIHGWTTSRHGPKEHEKVRRLSRELIIALFEGDGARVDEMLSDHMFPELSLDTLGLAV